MNIDTLYKIRLKMKKKTEVYKAAENVDWLKIQYIHQEYAAW